MLGLFVVGACDGEREVGAVDGDGVLGEPVGVEGALDVGFFVVGDCDGEVGAFDGVPVVGDVVGAEGALDGTTVGEFVGQAPLLFFRIIPGEPIPVPSGHGKHPGTTRCSKDRNLSGHTHTKLSLKEAQESELTTGADIRTTNDDAVCNGRRIRQGTVCFLVSRKYMPVGVDA